MTTVEQIISSSTVRPKRFRVDEFRKMTEAGILPEESGWEIIDGFLIDRMTIGSKHASIVKRLNKLLAEFLTNQVIISVQDPIHVDDYNEPEPDITLLKPRPDFYAESHPTPSDVLLLIEVSDSTIGYDRGIKMKLYAEAGIIEVWLVNLLDETIERYSLPANGRFGSVETFNRGDSIHSISLEYLTLNVDEILGSQ
ncbi:MAG: Uma2 family endonuclease [Pyrinomonadaceae bacterium]|nr:Uma2 family endonuclease [Blastocatellia bacterium]MDQ3490216.1 Uma2 family endonuclease [Acidobacteriota bacterium]